MILIFEILTLQLAKIRYTSEDTQICPLTSSHGLHQMMSRARHVLH